MFLVRPTIVTLMVAAGLVVGGAVAAAQPPAATVGAVCDGTTTPAMLASGTYHGLVVKGYCLVPDDAVVTIRGNVDVTAGSDFNAETLATVTITGSVTVGPDANFGLGCTFAAGCTGQTDDVLRGSIVADHPLALQLDGDTIYGSVSVTGGQAADCGPQGVRGGAPSNMPIKDNVIHGSVTISGWSGCWVGFIRNQVHGSVLITHVIGDGYQEGLGFNDSTEVASNVINGSLACYDNTHTAWLGDSGGVQNVIHGVALGECAGTLASAPSA